MKQWIKRFFFPNEQERLDISRRGFFASILFAVTGGMVLKNQPQSAEEYFNPALIRPPGSVAESEFLARCVRCGECMKVCVTNAIHPAGMEAGVEGIWTPVMKMDVGYCEYECTLCGQVCPTDAIKELTIEEKHVAKIGQAFFDKNRCLPHAFGRSCIVCEEHCPVADKAIWFEEVEVTDRDGNTQIIKKPYVDPEKCIGCGICSDVCPLKDAPGIYVSSAGEDRNEANQFLIDSGLDGSYSGGYSGGSYY